MLKAKNVSNTTVILDYADCVTDGGKYALICNNHGFLIQSDNKTRLWKFASEVIDWCEGCAGTDPRVWMAK